MAAVTAAQAQEAVRQDAALEERVELVLDEGRLAMINPFFTLGAVIDDAAKAEDLIAGAIGRLR